MTVRHRAQFRTRAAARIAATAAAGLTLAAGLVTAQTSPAAAYPNSDLTIRSAVVDTDDCSSDGSLDVYERGDYCVVPDSIDGTYFHKDANAVAAKAVVYEGDDVVAKFEFHPYGEKLWIYDTQNDGDSIYAGLASTGDASPYAWPVDGTSAKIDVKKWDFDKSEGSYLRLSICDGRDSYYATCTDRLTSYTVRA